ncbi:3-hydroxyacyl-CoA dehydrogenase family protein [Chloroflexota bacterium]
MKPEDIKSIGILGGGVMGSGIAQTAIIADYKVVLRDLTDEILQEIKILIINGRYGLKGGVERGKQTQEQIDKAVSNLSLTTKIEDLKDCDLIIEVIGSTNETEIENKELKRKVFAELDKIIKKDAIFATNTSYFTIADLAEVVERKSHFIGMHWFRPPNILKVVELTYTSDTSEEVIQVMEGVCQRMGKMSVRVKDTPGDPGFIGNRIFREVAKEARKIVEAGIATPEDVDIVMREGFGWALGPYQLGAGDPYTWV